MSEWRYVATRLNGNGTETVLEPDLPLSDVSITKTLSGPDGLSGDLKPEFARLILGDSLLIQPWSTAIYAEKDGQIRAGCIVTDRRVHNEVLEIEAAGFCGYLSEMPYLGQMEYANADPTAIVAAIWTHVQSYPGGNLGLQVSLPATPARTGPLGQNSQTRDPVTGQFKRDDGPRSVLLSWKETHDLGRVVTSLAKGAPFDFIEEHVWVGDSIEHRLVGGYPALGRRRLDLRFVVGENVLTPPDILGDGEGYASEVLVLGAGEGEAMIRAQAARASETRLRRVAVVNQSSIGTQAQANALSTYTLERLNGAPVISTLEVTDHPNAPLGAFTLGDEIYVDTGAHGWHSNLGMWGRIVEITYRPEAPAQARLKLMTIAA